MELQYSPRHSPGGSMHMLSPTPPHSADGFNTIRQIRRSLSRSPSKPSRFTLCTKGGGTSLAAPMSPAPKSPSHLSRAFSADSAQYTRTAPARTGVARTRSRRASPNSPLRRALSDNCNQANIAPRYATRRSSNAGIDQENMDCAEDMVKATPESHFGDVGKHDFARPAPDRSLLQPVMREHGSPMKSSPLKRSDGVMNLEAASLGSPRSTKRRSIHGASLGADFNIFDQSFDGALGETAEACGEKENEKEPGPTFAWSAQSAHSPQRRPFSLRKSTLQQRAGTSRKNLFNEAVSEGPAGPYFSRPRSRISLDGALPLRSPDFDSSVRRGNANDPPILFLPPAQKLYQSAPKPHPLSHALTPSSSTSSVTAEDHKDAEDAEDGEDDEAADVEFESIHQKSNQDLPKPPPGFSKSLPIGALRPVQDSGQGSHATPAAFKMAKPLPQAFMSTGLISKRHRNIDGPPASLFSSTMPDTPSKKVPHIQFGASPAPSALGKLAKPLHEFGSPSTPFNGRVSNISPESFGKGVNIFGSKVNQPQLIRRSSFLSVDGDDVSNSPTQLHLGAQANNDELPPTPTKSTSASSMSRPQSKGKSNSLRSSLFGRRTSLGPDTFASPADREHSPPPDDESPSPLASREEMEKQTPHTPQDGFAPPDPSNLSISVENKSSLFNSNSFPPATPTGPRADHFGLSVTQGQGSSGYFANDVDTAMSSRFAHVSSLGMGEFSQVYKVEQPHSAGPSSASVKSTMGSGVWAVKKSRRPYTGVKDRQRKMQEVQILKALRDNEHIVELVDEWEAKNHLYIQTEYCENGNLKDFLLSTGFKGRLDDFRIWKILLELSQGIKSIHDAGFIHLDLKPANIFIDWEGVLKIGDFGMASAWPAPPGIDGEGDREYIGPEVLSGRFDKPADIFSLGMIMLEIAGNIVLPDNGTSWQRLRAGDLSDLPSLTWSSDSSLVRDESGDPVELLHGQSNESLCASNQGDDDLSFLRPTAPVMERSQELVKPPNFMVDPTDPEALDRVVQWMICPDPDQRPVVDQLLAAGSVQWVEQRRRAGATVYEGNWGPADDVLDHEMREEDTEMIDI